MVGVFVATGLVLFANLTAGGQPGDLFDNLLARVGVQRVSKAHLEGPQPAYLTCPSVRNRVGGYLKQHYSFRKFTPELSQRTFQKLFQYLDPGKSFFLAQDIEQFRSYETTLDKAMARLDCSFITDTYTLFLQRVRESQPMVDAILGKTFDFTKDESIETDRKKIDWATTAEDLRERWRQQLKFMAMSLREAEPDAAEVTRKLKKRHELMRKAAEERTPDEIYDVFMKAFAFSLDPHSYHYTREELEDFEVNFKTALEGIGATLTSQDGYTVIDALIPGGPAARDGTLQSADKIIAVDSGDGSGFTNVVDMQLSKVVQLIRGKKGTTVRLTILRKGEDGEVTKFNTELVRDKVNIPDAVAKSRVIEVEKKRVGWIELPSFYIDYAACRVNRKGCRSSANDVLREIEKVKKENVDGIVLDLRFNGGGDLGECVRLVGEFIDEGPVVQVQDSRGEIDHLDDPEAGVVYSGPMVVLVSKQSASASEILAGAIQSYGRGLIVGDSRTYGKGTVQKVIELPGTGGAGSDGALKVTEQKFFLPSGSSNQSRGVVADLVVPSPMDGIEIGEEFNDYALPHSEIPSARGFTGIRDFTPLLAELRKRSQARIEKSEEFKNVFELIKKAKEDETVFSLKIDEKKEKKDKKDEKSVKSKKDANKTDDDDKAKKDPRRKSRTSTDKSEDPDFQVIEAAHILLDAVELTKSSDWASPVKALTAGNALED